MPLIQSTPCSCRLFDRAGTGRSHTHHRTWDNELRWVLVHRGRKNAAPGSPDHVGGPQAWADALCLSTDVPNFVVIAR